MTEWEKKILDAFTSRYFTTRARAAARAGGEYTEGSLMVLRLRSVNIFPGFDAAPPDEKESYIEAAESLEKKGLLSLSWEKHAEGERLKTITCPDLEKLFESSGGKNPANETRKIKSLIENRDPEDGFLGFIAEHIGYSELGRKIDAESVQDLVCLLDSLQTRKGITTRALSVELYNDSKRLEYLLDLFGPLVIQARKKGIPAPSFLSLARSFPETMIAGRIAFVYKDGRNDPPLANGAGLILGLPLQSVREISAVKTIGANDTPAVLTIENKETFYALADPRHNKPPGSSYDCFVYSGGYPSEATVAMLRLLAASGFTFYHSGDLDPGGILILQKIADIIREAAPDNRAVTPVRMDEAAFDRYLPWARPLSAAMLREAEKIREDTRAIPGIAALLRRIEETRRGVEQEIIDY